MTQHMNIIQYNITLLKTAGEHTSFSLCLSCCLTASVSAATMKLWFCGTANRQTMGVKPSAMLYFNYENNRKRMKHLIQMSKIIYRQTQCVASALKSIRSISIFKLKKTLFCSSVKPCQWFSIHNTRTLKLKLNGFQPSLFSSVFLNVKVLSVWRGDSSYSSSVLKFHFVLHHSLTQLHM